MSRRSFARAAAALAASFLLIAFSAVLAGPQDQRPAKPQAPPRTDRKEKGAEKEKAGRVPTGAVEVAEARAILDKMINGFDLKPQPQPAIPDDPPPHEGALIDIPLVVEPPDLILVEVLEALPGRPISGERLIRPDGTINLGFYGEVYVRGLTLPQIKVAIIKHLRTYLNDDTLGLITPEYDEWPSPEAKAKPLPHLKPPDTKDGPLDDSERGKAANPPAKPRASLGPRNPRGALRPTETRALAVRAVRRREMPQVPEEKKSAEVKPDAVMLPFPGQGHVKITIEVQGQNAGILVPNPPAGALNPPADLVGGEPGKVEVVPPLESDRVFVDVTAYNSKNYYVLGDVLIPGKLPNTGVETVLDALQYAGGLIPSAEPKDIRLVRPGRNGKPARVYKVALEAIQEKGDVRTNYQLFPGDRLVVGRNEVVKKTVEIDRLQAPIEAIVGSIHRYANMLRSIDDLSPDQADQVLEDLVDFWAKELSRNGELKFDEQSLREVLRRHLKKAPAGPRPGLIPGAR
jgi:protein involved in polysaccharide export with SLBB domain